MGDGGGGDEGRLAQRYRELIAAWARNDLVTVQQMHDPDCVLEIAGRHRYSGRFEGIGAVLAALVKYAAYVLQGDPVEERLDESDSSIEVVSRVTLASPFDSATTQTSFRTVMRFDDAGKIVFVRNEAGDQEALDRFFEALDAAGETRLGGPSPTSS